MPSERRPWTAADQQTLANLWQQGFDDKAIAYIMGRFISVIRRYRVRMGVKTNGKPGPAPGWKHTPEARAKISAGQYRRWERGGAEMRHQAAERMRACKRPKRATVPQRGDPTWPLYRKLREFMPREQALQEANRCIA